MFSSMVGLLEIQSLISSHAQIVRQGLPLVGCPSSLTKHHLATPTSSVPAMPQHIFQGRQIVGELFVAGLVSRFPI